ncbi:unnamed protein product [Polarella glacialis]|uniref:Major facilitator superfamily (MFS) profile domain-containing protein n=1 Tax=Polarella glacialis TaxID=89957 RepID=A0A813D6P1_POLGL|nr:unnamed protein product [Polarella glacialis]
MGHSSELSGGLLATSAEGLVEDLGMASGYLLGATVGGRVLDRSPNPARLLLVSTGCSAFSTALLPQLRSVVLVNASLLCQGGVMGLLDTGGNVLMLTVWRGSRHVNAAVHGFHFLFGLGAFLAPVFVSTCLRFGLEAMQAWVVAGLSFVPACLGLMLLVLQPQPKTGSQAGADSPLGSIVLITGAFLFAYVGLEVAFGGYIDAFAVRHLQVSPLAGASLTSVYWGALCISRLAATLLTPYVNHLRYIQLHLLLACVSMAAFGVVSWSQPVDSTPLAQSVILFTFLYGFALGPLFPGALLVAEEKLAVTKETLDGRAAGFTVACAALGEMCLPLLTGFFFAQEATSFAPVQLVVCCLAGIIFALGSLVTVNATTAWLSGELPLSDCLWFVVACCCCCVFACACVL